MNYIDNKIILENKVEAYIYVYVMMVIILILSLIIFFMLFHYKTYYDLKGTVINEDNIYLVEVYIPINKINYLVNNNELLINKKKYTYKITNISEEFLSDKISTYQIVRITLELPKEYQINNLTLKLKMLKEDKKIIDYLLRKE